MADFAKLGEQVRRRTREDGRVVDVQTALEASVDGGRVLSLDPPRVRMRTGETVDVDAYMETGVIPKVDDDVLVLTAGSFVLVVGKVVML